MILQPQPSGSSVRDLLRLRVDAIAESRADVAFDCGPVECRPFRGISGRMSRYLAERGCLVEGVDLSPGMIAMARRDHHDLVFTVGSLTDLPYPDEAFAGVMLWYSIIHTPPGGQARIFAEAGRVLRPGGHVLVGFQSGAGTRDVSWAQRHEIPLERHLYTAEHVASQLEAAGLREVCRLVRRAQGKEKDDQAVLLAKAD